jgi:hypothetical protein
MGAITEVDMGDAWQGVQVWHIALCFCESVWTVYSVAVQLGSEVLLVGKILMLPMSPYVPSLL